MSAVEAPSRGSLITYLDRAPEERLRLAEVTGPTMVDPLIGHTWVGARLPDMAGTVDVIDCARLVNVMPPR
jgi:hypothetical protein